MFYTIYKITNKLDGKVYIGKHQTKNIKKDSIIPVDWYKGRVTITVS